MVWFSVTLDFPGADVSAIALYVSRKTLCSAECTLKITALVGKCGSERPSPILHNLQPPARSEAARGGSGELGREEGAVSGEIALARGLVSNSLKWS